MKKIFIVCTHGNTGTEIVNSVQMIMGKQNNFYGVSFNENEGVQDLYQKIDQYINPESEIMIFVDILGGTPFNVSSQLSMKYKNIRIVTGVHIGMLLEVCLNRSNPLDELSLLAVSVGKNLLNSYDIKLSNEEDDF